MILQVNEEFKNLIPALAEEEYKQLEENILSKGCLSPINTYNSFIVDGHNRYEICSKHGLDFKIEPLEFEDERAVKLWMIDNQLGRRNISTYQRILLADKKLEYRKVEARENQSLAGGDKKSDGSLRLTCDKAIIPIDTKKEVAKIANSSRNTVAKVRVIEAKAPEEVKEKVKTGEITINKAYQVIKKEERKQDIERQKEAIETGTAVLPKGVFEVVAIDPPWNYGREYDPDGSRVANPYPEMSQEQLLNLDIPFANDAVVFLWTTQQFIWDAKELLDNWGFTYKATLVWDKDKIGMGSWLRMQCEFCLVGIKGKPIWNNTTWRDIIREPRREHSRKPDAFYELVESVTVGRKLEYFSREQRKNWEVFGNDTEKF